MVGEEIVMEAGIETAPDAAEAVCTLCVLGLAQTAGNQAPLYCEVLCLVDGEALVD